MLLPYEEPSITGSDPGTLKDKVMTGYQGWFNCQGDGAETFSSHNRKTVLRHFKWMADVLSPWNVGRFGDLSGLQRHAKKILGTGCRLGPGARHRLDAGRLPWL